MCEACQRLFRANAPLQVHDELIFDVHASKTAVEALKSLVLQCMEVEVARILSIQVPLTVKMCVGRTWGTMRAIPTS